MLVAIIIIAFKLRNVHDAYFVKKEVKFLGITMCICSAPFLTLTTLFTWAWSLAMILMIIFTIISFGLPVIIAHRSSKRSTANTSSELSDTYTTREDERLRCKLYHLEGVNYTV